MTSKKLDVTSFPKHTDTENIVLRTWNRVSTAKNISEDLNIVMAERYIEQFTKGEQAQMAAMLMMINKHGPEETLRRVMEAVNVGN